MSTRHVSIPNAALAVIVACGLTTQLLAYTPARFVSHGPLPMTSPSTLEGSSGAPFVTPFGSMQAVRFEPNLGQADARVRFLARGSDRAVFLTNDALVLSIPDRSSDPVELSGDSGSGPTQTERLSSTSAGGGSASSLRITFEGAHTGAAVVAENPLDAVVNDLRGSDPEKWLRGIPTYGTVRFRDIYDGIDAVFYGASGGLEYDLVVQPRADVSAVRLKFDGHIPSSLDPSGDLVFEIGDARVRCRRPAVFQPAAGGKRPVAASYELRTDGTVGFSLGSYDRSVPLVIDPVIIFSRPIGSSANDDFVSSSSWTASGRLMAAGFTLGSDFPTTSGPNEHRSTGGSDIVALEIDSNTLELVSSSYLGGTGYEYVYAMDVTPVGVIAITGATTSRDFPLRSAFQSTFPDVDSFATQGFVLVYRPDGAEIVFSTYLGGSESESFEGISFAPGGDLVVAGTTDSEDFPVVAGLGTPFNGGSSDAVVARFSPAGIPVFSTFLGGNLRDQATGVAVDDLGAIYVTGSTSGPDAANESFIPFPVVNGVQQQFGGVWDAYVAKLSPAAEAIVYSTFLGGRGSEFARDISVDGDHCAYVTGTTDSGDFPTTSTSATTIFFTDVFVTRLNASGSALIYSIVTGGTLNEYVFDLDLDAAGMATVSGTTDSIDLQTVAPIQSATGGGARDGFLLQVMPTGVVAASTYFGGPGVDQLDGAVADGSGGLFLIGRTTNPAFLTSALPATGPGGGSDAFIVRYVASPAAAPPSAPAMLTAGPSVSGGIDLAWVDTSADERSFKVERRRATDLVWEQITIVAANQVAFIDLDVDSSVGYAYRVRSSSSPLDSDYSNEATATAPDVSGAPAPPAFVVARPSVGGSASIAWSDSSRNETGFEVERSVAGGPWSPVATTVENVTWTADPSPPGQMALLYRVRSFNIAGESAWSLSAEIDVPALPSAPTGLVAQQFMQGGVANLSWADNSDNETGFRVERMIGPSGPWVVVFVSPMNLPYASDTFLERGVQYIYRVCAFNSTGSSAFSAEIGLVLAFGGSSGSLTIISSSTSSIGLQWSGVSGSTGFEIERRPASGGPFVVVMRRTQTTINGSYVDTGLPPNTSFVYRSRAYGGNPGSGVLYGGYTAEVTGTTGLMTMPSAVISVDSSADANVRNSVLTLREAILIANGSLPVGSLTAGELARISGTPGTPGFDEIVFAIGTGPVTIGLASALPTVSDAVRIDGRTQPGYAGTPLVQLSGAGVPGGTANGLLVSNAAVTILGLSITGFPADGVQIVSGSGSTISDCMIGTNAAGDAGLGNDGDGVSTVDSSSCTISGNLISGNGSAGVNLTTSGSGIYGSHVITANRIGTTASGLAANPNGVGVRFDVNVGGTVGGQSPTARNIVSGNSGDGVLVVGTSTGSVNVFGNFIGIATDGASPLPNGGYGIRSSRNFTYVRYGNVVSANALGGILIEPSEVAGPDFFVYESFIGTDATGMLARGNGGPGIDIDGHNYATVGSALGHQGNVIAGNAGPGVRVRNFSFGVSIAGNAIGTDRSGQLRIGNLGDGVLQDGPLRAVVGGYALESRNRIAFNGGAGVRVLSGFDNGIVSNQIYGNGGLAVDLGPLGSTPNDPGDVDTGANNLQNAPVLTGASYSGTTLSVAGTIETLPDLIVRIEYFAQPPAPETGAVMLGLTVVSTGTTGMADVSIVAQRRVPIGSRIWATATSGVTESQVRSTSEPSNTVPILGGAPPPGSTTVGVYVPATGSWFVRNSNSPGPADSTFSYGPGGAFHPIEGDWDGDGTVTPGIYDQSTGAFFLRNANQSGGADIVFTFGGGGLGFVPLAGDWDGDGVDTIGLYGPSSGVFFLRNVNGAGAADVVFTFGPGGAPFAPLVGDWNGDGIDSIGLYVSLTGTFFLKNTNAPGGADLAFSYGPAGAAAVTGDWDGDGATTVGVYIGGTGAWFLRNANSPGGADLVFTYGPANATAIAGNWDGI